MKKIKDEDLVWMLSTPGGDDDWVHKTFMDKPKYTTREDFEKEYLCSFDYRDPSKPLIDMSKITAGSISADKITTGTISTESMPVLTREMLDDMKAKVMEMGARGGKSVTVVSGAGTTVYDESGRKRVVVGDLGPAPEMSGIDKISEGLRQMREAKYGVKPTPPAPPPEPEPQIERGEEWGSW